MAKNKEVQSKRLFKVKKKGSAKKGYGPKSRKTKAYKGQGR